MHFREKMSPPQVDWAPVPMAKICIHHLQAIWSKLL